MCASSGIEKRSGFLVDRLAAGKYHEITGTGSLMDAEPLSLSGQCPGR